MTDFINQPPHYIEGRQIEPIDVIEDWNLGFHLGNAIKYLSRAGRKGNNPVEDLEKAVWYVNRYADKIEREADSQVTFADGFGFMSDKQEEREFQELGSRAFGSDSDPDPWTLNLGPVSTASPDVLVLGSDGPGGVTHQDVIDFASWKPSDWEA